MNDTETVGKHIQDSLYRTANAGGECCGREHETLSRSLHALSAEPNPRFFASHVSRLAAPGLLLAPVFVMHGSRRPPEVSWIRLSSPNVGREWF